MSILKDDVSYLESNGYLEYGKYISSDILSKLLNLEPVPHISYLGPLMNLKDYLDTEGYLCKITNLGIHILDLEDQAYVSQNIMKNCLKRMKKLESCLIKSNFECLDKTDFLKHLHASTKVSCALHSLKSSLADI
jgi:hypothetical protein